jgi:hypothetical protein
VVAGQRLLELDRKVKRSTERSRKDDKLIGKNIWIHCSSMASDEHLMGLDEIHDRDTTSTEQRK